MSLFKKSVSKKLALFLSVSLMTNMMPNYTVMGQALENFDENGENLNFLTSSSSLALASSVEYFNVVHKIAYLDANSNCLITEGTTKRFDGNITDGLNRGTYGTTATGATGTGTGLTIYGGSMLSSNGWAKDTTYWYFKTSTDGYGNLKLSFEASGSNTGPRDFIVEYSVDGGSFVPVGTYVLKNESPAPKQSFTLPEEANNCQNLEIRLKVNSPTAISGTANIGSGGTSRLDNFLLEGNPIKNGVELVSANPDSSAVRGGSTVELSNVGGDTIYYTMGKSDSYLDNPTTLSDEYTGGLTLDFTQSGVNKIKAIAVNDDGVTSAISEFIYTQKQLGVPTISPAESMIFKDTEITLSAEEEGADIYYEIALGDATLGTPTIASTKYTGPFTIAPGTTIAARAIGSGYMDSSSVTFEFKSGELPPVDTTQYNSYFGQLHAHSNASDGAGEVSEAFSYARDTAKLDYFALTDHSNSYDKAPTTDKAVTYNLGSYNASNEVWQKIKTTATEYTDDNFTGLGAYEMTWSGGPGHINTFFTEGFVSRNNTELNNKTGNAGMKAYYELLKNTPGSISQFNHPGNTFGNFANFSYRDTTIDDRITLLEVGNGEGAIGSGGHFPSYEQYTLALDKGWHVAPTNNQDNHKKGWGTSNDARSVIKAVDNTEASIKDAMANRRVFATEVKDLDIDYTVNDYQMGSIIPITPDELTFSAKLTNATDSNIIKSVHLVTNGGIVLGKQTFNTNDVDYEFTLDNPASGYYYLRATIDVNGLEAYAVTSPVWFGEADKFGFSEVKITDVAPETKTAFDVNTSLFNADSKAVTVSNIKYVDKNGTVLYDQKPENSTIAASSNGIDGTFSHKITYTPTKAGANYIDVLATILNANGATKTLTYRVDFSVLDSETTKYIGIDGSHYNEYVSGNYKDAMGNFTKLAAGEGVRVSILNSSEQFMEALSNPKFSTIILTAPTRRLKDITYTKYSNEELAGIKAFSESGGTIIVGGWSDYYENYAYSPKDPDMQMAASLNDVLEVVGSDLRVADDATSDNTNNGGQKQRLYLTEYNLENPLADRIVEGQIFSDYGGASVYVVDENGKATNELGNVSPLVYGFETTYSEDSDKDGFGDGIDADGTVPKYDDKLMVLGSEFVKHDNGVESLVVAGGSVFMSNFEVQAELDSYATLPYSNYYIAQNIINMAKPETVYTNIADVRNMEIGSVVTIDAIVTSETYVGNSTNNKGFFDSIYVQDSTGGINVFPVASDVILGKPVIIRGRVSEYQGEKQLDVAVGSVDAVTTASINYIQPTKMSTADTMAAKSTGLLVKTEGVVKNILVEDGMVNQIVVNDGSGDATVYINTYITTSVDLSSIKVGDTISVVGFASIGEVFGSADPAPRIRVRDREEIVKVNIDSSNGDGDSSNGDGDSSNGDGDSSNGDGDSSNGGGDSSNDGGESSNGDSSSSNGGGSTSSNNTNDNIKVDIKNNVVIAIPKTTSKDNVTTANITLKDMASKLENAKDIKTLEISIGNSKDAKKVVNFDNAIIKEIAKLEKLDLVLTYGNNEKITLDDRAIKYFAGKDIKEISIVFEKSVDKVVVDVYADNKRIDDVNGTLKIELPKFGNGTVLVSVNPNGTETIIITSLVEAGVVEALLKGSCTLKMINNDKEFNDIVQNGWYKSSIDFVSSRELIRGTAENTFAPEEQMSRAMIATILYRLDGTTEKATSSTYSDLKPNAWYYDSINWASNHGIMGSDTDTNFNPNAELSREEVVTALYEYSKSFTGLEISTDGKLDKFTDSNKLATKSVDAMKWAVGAGIINGTDKGELNPKGNITRAEFAAMVEKFVNVLVHEG